MVMRSARSPLLREAGDLSSALTDADGHLVAQGRDIPMHMGVMSFTVREFLKRVPKARLAPGDVWFLNLPEIGGNHLPDVKAIRPVFVDGRHRRVRGQPGPTGRTSAAPFPAAMSLAPPTPGRRGCASPRFACSPPAAPIARTSTWCSPTCAGPDEREGDILAQMAATRGAEAQLHRLFAEHGADTVLGAIARHPRPGRGADARRAGRHPRRHLRRRGLARRRRRGGRADRGAGPGDHRGRRRDVRLLGQRGRGAGPGEPPRRSSPRRRCSTWSRPCSGRTSSRAADATGRSRSSPAPARCSTPDRSGRWWAETTRPPSGSRDAVFRALEPTGPERLSAGGPTTSGLVLFGGRRADGVWTTFYETHGGGEGARHDPRRSAGGPGSTCRT